MSSAVTLPPTVSSALARFKVALDERFGSRLSTLILFGSHARGAAHEESDVDVLVGIDDLSDDDHIAVLDLAYAVDRAAEDWVGLSPLVYSTERVRAMRVGGRRLFRDIDGEGIAL